MSICRLFVSARLALAILSFSAGSPGGAQSFDPQFHEVSDASVSAIGVPGRLFAECGDPLMNVSRPCHENQELFDANSPQVTFHPRVPAGTVSVDALRYPLSGKALRSIEKAQSLIQAGDHVRAFEQLREAAKIASAAPYAYSLLGQEHLRLGEAEAAVPELQQAARSLPSSAAVHANLGLALLMTGQARHAEQELRRALHLGPDNPQTQLILGVAVLDNGSHDEEGTAYLRAAARRLSVAHVVLGAYFARTGRLEAAEVA